VKYTTDTSIEEVEIDTSELDIRVVQVKEQDKKSSDEPPQRRVAQATTDEEDEDQDQNRRQPKKDEEEKKEEKHDEYVLPSFDNISDNSNISEVTVYEGSVYVKDRLTDKTAILNQGGRLTTTRDDFFKLPEEVPEDTLKDQLKEWAGTDSLKSVEADKATVKIIEGEALVLIEKDKEEAQNVQRAPAWRPVKDNEKIVAGDQINTLDDTRVDLVIGRDVVKISSNTRIKVLELKPEAVQLDIAVGAIMNEVAQKAQTEVYEIYTPVSIIGVRGTRFEVQVSE